MTYPTAKRKKLMTCTSKEIAIPPNIYEGGRMLHRTNMHGE